MRYSADCVSAEPVDTGKMLVVSGHLGEEGGGRYVGRGRGGSSSRRGAQDLAMNFVSWLHGVILAVAVAVAVAVVRRGVDFTWPRKSPLIMADDGQAIKPRWHSP